MTLAAAILVAYLIGSISFAVLTSRAFRLPKAVDRDQVQATMREGVLSVRLPKAEHARPRRIPVRVATLAAGEAAPRQITAAHSESNESD